MVHSFLMIGQSNMAGRGRLGDVPPLDNPDLFMLRNGRWQPLREPVNYDRFGAGIGLAPAFADEYAKQRGVKTGLIPCADGGTSLENWAPGGQLYEHAVAQARLAGKISEVKGILWHQGEADSRSEQTAKTYGARFLEVINALRRDSGLEDVPVALGELGEFMVKKDTHPFFSLVNKELERLAQTYPWIALASASGLTTLDGIHFDAPSCREFGKRYFQVFAALQSRAPEEKKG